MKKDNKQRKAALKESIKAQLKVAQFGKTDDKKASISLPNIPDMNEDNVKPFFYDVLGYTPEIISFDVMQSVVVVTIKMK